MINEVTEISEPEVLEKIDVVEKSVSDKPRSSNGTSEKNSTKNIFAQIARKMHQQLATAQDAATSNAALLQILASATDIAGAGGFASVTENLLKTSEHLQEHVSSTLNAIRDSIDSMNTFAESIDAFE